MKKDGDGGALAIFRRSSITLGTAVVAAPRYEGIAAFSETGQTEELKAIEVPTLYMQGPDQVVPDMDAVEAQVKLIKNSIRKVYHRFSHGMRTVNADVINAGLLTFICS